MLQRSLSRLTMNFWLLVLRHQPVRLWVLTKQAHQARSHVLGVVCMFAGASSLFLIEPLDFVIVVFFFRLCEIGGGSAELMREVNMLKTKLMSKKVQKFNPDVMDTLPMDTQVINDACQTIDLFALDVLSFVADVAIGYLL